jgi:hypothetical protein
MVLVIKDYERQTKEKVGLPCNLPIEDQLLLLLEYYHENHTFFHLGFYFGISASYA